MGTNSDLLVRSSSDLVTWSGPTTLLTPTVSWEKETTTTVGNPYVRVADDGFWLYFSASGVWYDDLGFHEPKYVGLARADAILGPYTRVPEPLLGPEPDATPEILGAGSFKMLDDRVGGRWLAAQNTMYRDAQGKTRSAIRLLSSLDGRSWQPVCSQPILGPTGDGWEAGLIYAFDTVRAGDSVRLYYNARESWDFDAIERIGMATLPLPCTR